MVYAVIRAKVLRFVAMLYCLFVISNINIAQANSSNNNKLARSFDAKVVNVIDGDTFIVVHNGVNKRIRIIGINSPELGGKHKQDELFAFNAKQFSTSLIQGRVVHIVLGQKAKDNYGRTLAYVYINSKPVSVELARMGLAYQLTMAPNVTDADLIKNAVAQARLRRLNIWKTNPYQAVVNLQKIGFSLVKGKITEIKQNSKKAMLITIDNNLLIHINAKNKHYFNANTIVVGKNIEVSGYVTNNRVTSNKAKYFMSVSHPSMFKIL